MDLIHWMAHLGLEVSLLFSHYMVHIQLDNQIRNKSPIFQPYAGPGTTASKYGDLLFTVVNSIGDSVSGVILTDIAFAHKSVLQTSTDT
jgi:hypothetical protein